MEKEKKSESDKKSGSKKWNRGDSTLVGIAIVLSAIVLTVSVIGVVLFFTGGSDAGRLLAEGWGNTTQMLSQRYSGGPLSAMADVLKQEPKVRNIGLTVSDLEAEGGVLEGTLGLEVSQAKGQLALMANSSLLGFPLDLQFFYNKDFVGLGSRSLLNSDIVYGATPGQFTEEAKGSIFDPATGAFPVDADVLKELDDVMTDFGSHNYDTDSASLDETIDLLLAQYEELLKGIKSNKSMGTLPSTGADATVLTYVYPSDKVIDTLQAMGNIYWDSVLVSSYYNVINTSSKQIGYDLEDVKSDWNNALIDLKTNYSGDITVRYFLVDHTLAYLDVSALPTYDGDTAEFEAYLDFGVGGDTLTAEITLRGEDTIQLSFSSRAVLNEIKSDHKWRLENTHNGNTISKISGGCSWDKSHGPFQAFLQLDGTDSHLLLNASGSLTVGGTDKFELTLDKLRFDDGITPFSFGLTLTHEAGEVCPQPQNAKNIFTLTEEEFYQTMTALGD